MINKNCQLHSMTVEQGNSLPPRVPKAFVLHLYQIYWDEAICKQTNY
jgi:hypothetical protein